MRLCVYVCVCVYACVCMRMCVYMCVWYKVALHTLSHLLVRVHCAHKTPNLCIGVCVFL